MLSYLCLSPTCAACLATVWAAELFPGITFWAVRRRRRRLSPGSRWGHRLESRMQRTYIPDRDSESRTPELPAAAGSTIASSFRYLEDSGSIYQEPTCCLVQFQKWAEKVFIWLCLQGIFYQRFPIRWLELLLHSFEVLPPAFFRKPGPAATLVCTKSQPKEPWRWQTGL